MTIKLTIVDQVGMAHDAEPTLMGICPRGHNWYVVIVPFPIDPADPPRVEVSELDDSAHLQVIGMGITADGTPQPWEGPAMGDCRPKGDRRLQVIQTVAGCLVPLTAAMSIAYYVDRAWLLAAWFAGLSAWGVFMWVRIGEQRKALR